MKIKDMHHLPLTKGEKEIGKKHLKQFTLQPVTVEEVERAARYLGNLTVEDGGWAFDADIPDNQGLRHQGWLVAVTYKMCCEILKLKERLGEKQYEDLLRRDQ